MSRVYSPEGLTLGILLVALGVLGTLGNLGRIDLLSTLQRWWPLALVIWGACELVAALANRPSVPGVPSSPQAGDPKP